MPECLWLPLYQVTYASMRPPGLVDGLERSGVARPVFHRAELGLGERVVVRHARLVVGFGHAEVRKLRFPPPQHELRDSRNLADFCCPECRPIGNRNRVHAC